MPNHLQDRTADMHRGKDNSSKFGLKSLVIGVILVGTVAVILLLT